MGYYHFLFLWIGDKLMTFRSANAVRAGWFAVVSVAMACHGAWAVVTATYELGTPTFTPTQAQFEVVIDYQGDMAEELVFFSIDVSPSSPSLIGPGPDFSAFSFTPASPLLDDWTQIGFFNDPFFESTIEFEDTLLAPLATGVSTLGVLSVDFAAVGLGPGDPFTVSIEGFDSVIGVEDAAAFRFEPVDFNPGSRTITVPPIVPPPSGGIPEPLTIATGMLGIASLGWALRRRRRA